VRSVTEPDLFDNNVPFTNTTPIYLITLLSLLWKLGLGLGLNLKLLYFNTFSTFTRFTLTLTFSIFHG